MMNEKIKNHFIKHKEAYIVGGCSILVAGFTCAIMRRHYCLDAKQPYVVHRTLESSPTEHSVSLYNSYLSNAFNTKIVNVKERDGRGHPGYMIRCMETNTIYESQKAAAAANNVSQTHLCDHLNGRLDHVDGKHFHRVFREEAA